MPCTQCQHYCCWLIPQHHTLECYCGRETKWCSVLTAHCTLLRPPPLPFLNFLANVSTHVRLSVLRYVPYSFNKQYLTWCVLSSCFKAFNCFRIYARQYGIYIIYFRIYVWHKVPSGEIYPTKKLLSQERIFLSIKIDCTEKSTVVKGVK